MLLQGRQTRQWTRCHSYGLTKHENHLRGWIILALAANCKYIQHSFSQNFNDLFAKKMIFNTFSMSKWTIGATNILYQNHKMLTFICISVDIICLFWFRFNNNNLRYLISTIQCTIVKSRNCIQQMENSFQSLKM